jgi:hypothetical protein
VIQRGRLADAIGSVEEDDKIGAVQVELLSAAWDSYILIVC